MSLMNLFSGPTPEKLEARGDALLASGQWGQAKQLYERALGKYAQAHREESFRCRQVREKIHQTRDALAREHQTTAKAYLDGGYVDEAREMLGLAIDICHDPSLEKALARQLEMLDIHQDEPHDDQGAAQEDHFSADNHDLPPVQSASREELFQALCHTLPEDVSRAYRSYDQAFIDGYVALNEGRFESAAILLEQAMAQNPQPDSYIPLELATAYVNIGRLAEARELLENVRRHHPEALPVYQLLCEIYWDWGASSEAEALLTSLPPHLAQSRAVIHLKGQTHFRAGRYESARNLYRDYLDTFGWHEVMALELAQTLESLQATEEAIALYGKIIHQGKGCRSRVDPWIKHKYAELSFGEGHMGNHILELYLSLAREIPAHADTYFERISAIYQSQGNRAEADRFEAFAARARSDKHQPAG